MNKRLDLALDEFLSKWINGNTPPRYSFYTLESEKVVVDRSIILESESEELDRLLELAITKEREYFSKKDINE